MGGKSMLIPKTPHPASRTLLAYLDGELPVEERLDVRNHVDVCFTCREELDTMEADLDWFLVLEAASRTVEPPAPAGGLDRLLSAARAWHNSSGETAGAEEENGRATEQRAARALELFFGPTVAAALHSQDETESAESLLATFLGRRAADALMMDLRLGNHSRIMAPDVS
jgi:anti-sigma factor RsiW